MKNPWFVRGAPLPSWRSCNWMWCWCRIILFLWFPLLQLHPHAPLFLYLKFDFLTTGLVAICQQGPNNQRECERARRSDWWIDDVCQNKIRIFMSYFKELLPECHVTLKTTFARSPKRKNTKSRLCRWTTILMHPWWSRNTSHIKLQPQLLEDANG